MLDWTKAGVSNSQGDVGRFPQGGSKDGVEDLVGLVWQWTADAGTDFSKSLMLWRKESPKMPVHSSSLVHLRTRTGMSTLALPFCVVVRSSNRIVTSMESRVQDINPGIFRDMRLQDISATDQIDQIDQMVLKTIFFQNAFEMKFLLGTWDAKWTGDHFFGPKALEQVRWIGPYFSKGDIQIDRRNLKDIFRYLTDARLTHFLRFFPIQQIEKSLVKSHS